MDIIWSIIVIGFWVFIGLIALSILCLIVQGLINIGKFIVCWFKYAYWCPFKAIWWLISMVTLIRPILAPFGVNLGCNTWYPVGLLNWINEYKKDFLSPSKALTDYDRNSGTYSYKRDASGNLVASAIAGATAGYVAGKMASKPKKQEYEYYDDEDYDYLDYEDGYYYSNNTQRESEERARKLHEKMKRDVEEQHRRQEEHQRELERKIQEHKEMQYRSHCYAFKVKMANMEHGYNPMQKIVVHAASVNQAKAKLQARGYKIISQSTVSRDDNVDIP